MQSWPQSKDPQDKYKLRFDWSNRLEDGDTIVTSTFEVVGTATIDQEAIDGGFTTFRISGGTAGEANDITNHVVMSNGDEWDQTARLRVRQN